MYTFLSSTQILCLLALLQWRVLNSKKAKCLKNAHHLLINRLMNKTKKVIKVKQGLKLYKVNHKPEMMTQLVIKRERKQVSIYFH
jgi:hypothetical protein